jgi:hypothetical protein
VFAVIAASSTSLRRRHATDDPNTEATMAKGQQGKKETKKEPKLTLKEKRAAKAAKKAMKG